MPGNQASTNVMRKLGLEFQGEFESAGTLLVRYGLEREQYLAKRREGGTVQSISARTNATH